MAVTDLAATLTVFDVGHGDHLLLRIAEGERAFHAVVDCHWTHDSDPPALTVLRETGVEALDLLVLTHPHKDHFMGLARIAEHFGSEGRTLARFIDFGLDLRQVADRQFKRGHRCHHELTRLYAATVGRRVAGQSQPRYTALKNVMPPRVIPGFARCLLASIGPDPESWRDEHRRLVEGRPVRPNRVSAVLLWRIAEAVVLLCADLEEPDWTRVINRCRDGGLDLRADVVKVAHHGADNASSQAVWSAICRSDGGRKTHAVISTRGSVKHPSERTLRTIIGEGALPRCTAYGPVCEPHVTRSRRAAARRQLGLVARKPTPRHTATLSLGLTPVGDRRCFGSVALDVGADGQVTVRPAVANARCHLRDALSRSV